MVKVMAETRIEKALNLAVRRHKGQMRDDETPLPYITHVAEVMANLRFVGKVDDEDMLCAAALHDLLESTETTADEIRKSFGDRVAGLVLELTRTEPSGEVTAELDKDDLRDLRSNLLLADVSRMSEAAQAIKLADRLSNLHQAIAVKKGKRLSRYLKQTKAILAVIDRSVNAPLHKTLSELVDRYD